MIKSILSLLWWLLMLPIRLIMLPFKIVSFVVSLVIYSLVLLLIIGIVWFVIL